MLFAHDTEVALVAAAALVNTAHGTDELATQQDLDRFLDFWQFTGARTHDVSELRAVQELRPVLERLFHVDRDEAVSIVNRLLRDANALPYLVRHDSWDYHLHATSPDAPLADRMAVEAAMAVVDVIRMDELDRMRACAADDCADVLVDVSRNRSRRFCGTTCANRTNVAAFRARRRGRAEH